jgi:hypothetical protein
MLPPILHNPNRIKMNGKGRLEMIDGHFESDFYKDIKRIQSIFSSFHSAKPSPYLLNWG